MSEIIEAKGRLSGHGPSTNARMNDSDVLTQLSHIKVGDKSYARVIIPHTLRDALSDAVGKDVEVHMVRFGRKHRVVGVAEENGQPYYTELGLLPWGIVIQAFLVMGMAAALFWGLGGIYAPEVATKVTLVLLGIPTLGFLWPFLMNKKFRQARQQFKSRFSDAVAA